VEAVRRLLRALPLLCAVLAFPAAAFSHRLDEYLQATIVALEPDTVLLKINLTPGVAVAAQVLALLDRDQDGAISAPEAAAYAGLLDHDLTARLDGQNLTLRLTRSEFPEVAELRSGWGIISLEFTAQLPPLAPGAHTLSLENRHLASIGVYLLNAARPKSSAIQITAQKRNENQSTGEIGFTFQPAPQP
jgi:hypothetical protein